MFQTDCNSILAQALHDLNPPLCMLCVVMTSGQENVPYTRTDQSFIASTLSLLHTCLDLLRKLQPTIDKLRRLELAVHHLSLHVKGIKTNQKKLAAKLRPLRPMVRDIHKLKAKQGRLFSALSQGCSLRMPQRLARPEKRAHEQTPPLLMQ